MRRPLPNPGCCPWPTPPPGRACPPPAAVRSPDTAGTPHAALAGQGAGASGPARLHNRPAGRTRCAEGGCEAVWLWRSAGAGSPARGCERTWGGRCARRVGRGACAARPASVSPGLRVSASCLLLPTTSAAVSRDKAAPGRGRARGSSQSQRRWARPQLRLIEPTSNQTPGKRKPLSGLLASPPPGPGALPGPPRCPQLLTRSFPLGVPRKRVKTLWGPSSGVCPQEFQPQRGDAPRGHSRGRTGGAPFGGPSGKGADSEAQGDWTVTAKKKLAEKQSG